MSDTNGPLAGLRVLDLGTRIAAPFCAGLLGEMGADVVKIEQPGRGDFIREIGPFVPGNDGNPYSLFWAVEGRGPVRSRSTCASPKARTCSAGLPPPPTSSSRTSGPARSSAGTSRRPSSILGSWSCASRCSAKTDRPRATRARSRRHRLRRPDASHRLPRPAARARRRDDLRLPHRRVRRPGRGRGALPA